MEQKNPAYKGKWSPPKIDNPLYKGVWAPRKIKNPDYFEDKTPANFEPIGGIGFELWTMQGDILFDNIYIGHSIEDADALKKETWDIKKNIETKLQEQDQPKDDDPIFKDTTSGFSFEALKADPVKYVTGRINLFIDLVKADPIHGLKTVPEVTGTIGVIVVSLLLLLIGGGTTAAQSPAVNDAAKRAKEQAVDAKDKAAEAVSSGAEKAQNEVNKRTTRSSGAAE